MEANNTNQDQDTKGLSRRQLNKLKKLENEPKIPFEELKQKIAEMPDMNEFKAMEKTYKLYHNVNTDFSECLDFSDPKLDLTKYNIIKKQMKGYDVYQLGFPHGVYIIKNCLSIQQQLDIAKTCLNKYIHAPYRTNLFIYNEEQKKWKDQAEKKQDEQELQQQQQQQNCENTDMKQPSEYSKDKFVVNDFKKFNFDTKIRWTNVGSQYDWDNRNYPQVKTPLPQQIKELSTMCQEIFKEEISNVEKYEPESVIINFYHKKSYMTGHLDDGEEEQVQPIFSFSFGSSCVFLMGDKHKDFKPLPIILSSGDMMVMSGYSRNCYHGVPRVIQDSFKKDKYIEYLKVHKPELFEEREKKNNIKDFENDEIHVLNFFEQSRINLNFRQVLSSNYQMGGQKEENTNEQAQQ